MPKVNIPGVGKVNFPDSMSHDDIVSAIESDVIPQYKQHLEKTGFAAATKAGWHGAKGSAEKYLGELTGSETLKRYAEENKAKASSEFEPTTEQDVTNAQGILPTAGAFLSRKVTEPVGGIIGGFGAPIALAAATPFVAPEALGAAGVAALSAGVGTVAGLPSMAGETLERQEALGQKPDLVNATAAGLFKSALMNITIPGMGVATKGISKALGNSLESQAQGMARKVIDGELSHEAAVKSLSGYGQQLARNMAINATTGSAMMVGSEAADRVATGESLTSPEALEAYGHNIQAAAELSPIFGALHGLGERGRAKETLADAKDRNETINQVNADRAQRNLDITDIKEANRARAEAAFKAADEAQRAAIREQIKADPNRSLIDIINEATGVNAEPVNKTRQGFATAWNEPSGRMVSDPETGIERELTIGEMHQQQYPELFAEEPVPEPLALPAPEMISYPNGVVAHPDAVRNYITSLPEAERNAARAELLGYAKQPVPQVPGIVTPEPIPVQKLINQNLGIGKKPYTSTPENVKAALTEQTGARVQKAGQIERPETEFDMLKRDNPEAFAEAPLTSLPPLDKVAIEHMGFKEGKAGYAPLLKLGKDPIGNADKINDVLDFHLKSNKTLNTEAIDNYRGTVDAIRQNQGPDVSAESRVTGAADQPSVPVPKPRGQRVAEGTAGATIADVGDVRVPTSELGAGETSKPAPLVESAKAPKDLTTPEGVVADGINRLIASYKTHGGEEAKYNTKTAHSAISRVEDGIIDRLVSLGMKSKDATETLIEHIIPEAKKAHKGTEQARRENYNPNISLSQTSYLERGREESDIAYTSKFVYDDGANQHPADNFNPSKANGTIAGYPARINKNEIIVYDKYNPNRFTQNVANDIHRRANGIQVGEKPDYVPIGFFRRDENNNGVEHIVVSNAYRREGIGSAILDSAKEQGVDVSKAKDRSPSGSALLTAYNHKGAHTAQSLRSELTAEFGEQGIASLEKRGILNLHDTVDRAPEHIRNAVESDAIGAHSEGVTHLFADRIAKGEGRRGLLHEVGEHYGLKGMLGERIYNNVLDTIGKNARRDPVIKEAIDHVARNYPELRDNPAQFAREVVARVGETAPTHTVWRRIVAGVKNFLVKMGLMKNLNARDIQDLIQHSLRTAMKRDIVAPKRGIEAGRLTKNVGYHAGDLGYGRDTVLGRMGGRSTGHFGTGVYFTGSKEALGPRSEGRPVKTVNFDDYILAKPESREAAFALHDGLKIVNNLVDSVASGETEWVGHWGKKYTLEGEIQEASNKIAETLNIPVKKVEATIRESLNEAANKYESVAHTNKYEPSASTKVMQKLGFDGVDVRGIHDLDNTAYGSVIYAKDLQSKVESAKKGTAGKRLDGSPLKQPKPYTGRMPESIKKVIDGEGPMWERLGRQLGAFKNKVGTAVVSKAYNIERKALDKGIAGVSSKQQGELRGDRIYQQAQSASALSHSGMQLGGLRLMPSGLVEAFADKENPANMVMIADNFNKLVNRASKELGNEDTAHDMLSMAWVGPRYENIIRNNERLDAQIDNLRATKPEGYGAVVEQLQSKKRYVGDWTEGDRATAREGEKRYGKELADIRNTWNTMRGRLLDFMVETQNMTKELAEEYLENIDYVPFYRIPAEELVDTNFRPLTGSSLQNAGRQYRFKGSDKTQADPITNMMANVSWMMQKGIQNNAALRLAKLEEQMGEGRWVDAENPAVKGRTVTIYKEGKPKEFILDDVNDMAAFGGNPILQGMVWDVARGFTSFLRHGVTMFPQFVWNQAWEDPIRATFVSGNKAGFASNIANTWKSIYKNQISAEHTAGAEALYRSGVIGQKDVMSERDVERRYSGADKSGFRKSLFFFERLAQGSDLGARESIYNNAMKELKAEGYDEATAHAVATSRAIQYMPHQQVGNSRTMAYLRAMMPFVNSPIQGYARDIAAARGRIDGVSKEQGQKMLMLRLAKYAAFIGAYAAFRSGDPDYENQTADQRDNNFYIGGTKIPAPQELRAFKAAIERGTRAYALNAPGADLEGSDIGAAILRKNWELVAGLALPVPTAIRPVLEGVTNYNIHTGRPLVGQGLQDREPAMQYNDNTSEIGKLMGSIMNVSPIKVDNFISGYGGYLGQTVEKFSNVLVEGRPAQSVNDWLFVGNLMEPEYGGGPRTETYELADKVARVKSTMKALKDEGRIEELKQYIQENRGYIGGEDSVSRAHQAVTNIRRYQAQVNASNMDPDAKRAKLDQLKQTELDALANIHELHRKIEEANNAGS